MFTIHSCCSIVRPSNLMYFDVTSFVLVHVREKRWVARYTMFVRSSGAQLFAGCVECIWMRQTLHSPRMLSSWWLGAKKRLWSQCFWNSLFSAHFQLIVLYGWSFFISFFMWKTFFGFLQLLTFILSWIFTQEAVQTRTSGPLFATFGYAVASGHPFISKMQVSNRKKNGPPHPPCEECLGVTFPVESQQ